MTYAMHRAYDALMTWTFGIAVATARRMAGLEQAELAEKLLQASGRKQWKQEKISRLENGRTKPSVEDLMDLARVQGMDYSWYLDGPSAVASAANEANPGQLRSKRRFFRFPTSAVSRPSFSF